MSESELFRVVTPNQALETLVRVLGWSRCSLETVDLEESLGRYLGADIVSFENVPAFDRSTMDGYAVRAADTFGASENNPALFRVIGGIEMGKAATQKVNPGETLQIPTGGMLPEGADSVVMVEYSTVLDSETVEIGRAVAPGDNVVRSGEDVKAGTVVAPAGKRLGPYDIGVLAAIGASKVEVFKPISVGILSTGNEIVDADKKLLPGQVRDINYYVLSALLKRSGAKPLRLGIAPDDEKTLTRILRQSLESCDLVLISGGSSVGALDLTPAVINRLGEPGVLIHGLSIKPGKPTIVAAIGKTPLIGLPGNSVSAIDAYAHIVDPLIKYMYSSGLPENRALIRARLGRNISSLSGREDRVRVSLAWRDNELWAMPLLGKSALISLMSSTDAVAVIPFEAEGVSRGDEVQVELTSYE